MAIDATVETLPSDDQQQQVASQLHRSQTSERRSRQNKSLQQVDEALSAAAVVANKAYTSLWDLGEDLMGQFALGFYTVGNLLLAPFIGAAYLIRLIVGNLMHGGYEVRFRTFSLKAVPGIPIYDIKRHAVTVGLLLLFLVQVTLIYFVLKIGTDPIFAAKVSICTIFHAFCN